MQPVSDSRFTGRYVLPGCRVRAGDRLRLEAEAGGFDPVGGETVIPDPVEVLSVDTVRFTRFGYGGYEYPSIRLYVRFRDKLDKRNYYRLIIEKQTEFQKGDSVITCSSMYRSELNYTDWLGVVYEDPVFRSTVTNPVIEQLDGTTCRGTFTDDMFDGKDYTVRSSFWPVDSSFKGDSVTTTVHYDIRLMAISEEYYRYLVVIRNFSISVWWNPPPLIRMSKVVLELLPVANWPIAVLQCLSVIKNPLGIRLPFMIDLKKIPDRVGVFPVFLSYG